MPAVCAKDRQGLHAPVAVAIAPVLADVGPDGQAILVSQGILRASFRESLSDPTPLIPGKRYQLDIELSDLGHAFLPGHRLQLIVCSCLFPYYHPNPNTGALYGDEGDRAWIVATQTVFSGGTAGSQLTLHTGTA